MMTLKKRVIFSIFSASIFILVIIISVNFLQLKNELEKEIKNKFEKIHSVYRTFENFELSRIKESQNISPLRKVNDEFCSVHTKVYDVTEKGTVLGYYIKKENECYLIYSPITNILKLISMVTHFEWMIIYDKKYIQETIKEYGIQDEYIKDKYVFEELLVENVSDGKILELINYTNIEGYKIVGEFPEKSLIIEMPLLLRGEIPAGKLVFIENLAPLYNSYIKEFLNLSVYNFILTFLISFIVYMAIRRVVAGIELIKDIAESFQKGNFSKIEYLEKEVTREKSRDEIYSLKHSILIMGERLKELIDEIKTERDKLQEIAYIDHLTGLYNRRFFFEHVKIIIENAKRYRNIFTIVIFDIDNFKHINDNYGHDVGDKVLKEFANILKTSVRSSDIVSRFGGEEFVLILQNSDAENSFHVAERIRKQFSQKKFKVNDKYISTTVSGGISTYREEIEDIDQMIKEADIALYEAKKTGKNKIIIYKEGMELNSDFGKER